MPVDVGDESVRIRQRDPGLFVESSFRTITISEEQGIKAVIGKLKSDPAGSTVIQSYIFDREKWSASEAEAWVKDHKKSASSPRPRERRSIAGEEIRLSIDSKRATISGYAAVFDQDTALFDGFYERVAKGAFSNTIANDDVRALWNHNDDFVLGRLKNGTLKLAEDDHGLRYEILPPDTEWAKGLVAQIKRGDVDQASFGFNIEEQIKRNEGTNVYRTLKRVRLFDISPVTFPAYPTTSADVHVRMIRSDSGRYCLFEDDDEVIELPDPEAEIKLPSAEDIFKRIDNLKRRVS